jgi:hypothetical protein
VDDDDNQPDNGRLMEAMEARYGSRNSKHTLQPRRPCHNGHLHTTLKNTVMTHNSLKKSLKEFGDAGISAVLTELKQLHNLRAMAPKSGNKMTHIEKKRALQYLMFLKKKRNGKIMGRGCADRRKQREYTKKEDASAPMVAIESVLLSCVIHAKESRDVATVDIPGAFLQADMVEMVHMKLQGKMAELMVKLDQNMYQKYVQIEKGKQVLYVELKKALYGTLRAALLFWKKLSAKVHEWGFVINLYDWCVASKVVA